MIDLVHTDFGIGPVPVCLCMPNSDHRMCFPSSRRVSFGITEIWNLLHDLPSAEGRSFFVFGSAFVRAGEGQVNIDGEFEYQ